MFTIALRTSGSVHDVNVMGYTEWSSVGFKFRDNEDTRRPSKWKKQMQIGLLIYMWATYLSSRSWRGSAMLPGGSDFYAEQKVKKEGCA